MRRSEIGLIFTLDYEIHGNGSGEFENWAYLPTAHILDIFDLYGAKLTIMAEMGHYWAMKRYPELFQKELELFETQLKNAIVRGHDVQMHFHPQWIDAEYLNGNWNLDFSRKNIERLCYNYDEAYFYLKKGKEDLENLLTPVNPEYKCVSFRSGFLQIQPSEIIVKALVDAGFLIDTTVTKGMKMNDSLISVDFTSAYSNFYPWKISGDDICRRDDSGKLVEFPIFSNSLSFFHKVIDKLAAIKGTPKMNEVISGLMASYGRGQMPVDHPRFFSGKLKRMLKSRWVYVDYCQEEYKNLIKIIRRVISGSRKTVQNNFIPIVFLSHSKDFFFANNLSRFLQNCQTLEKAEFTTFLQALNKYSDERNR